jgi:acetyl esterase/lipase
VSFVLSQQAALIRASLVPEMVEPDLTLEAERRAWEEAARHDRLAAGTTELADTIAGRPVRWIEPDGVAPNAPVMVYAHGGGLTTGSPSTHRAFASRLAAECRTRLLLVDYRLLPDSPFPAPLDDVVAVVDELVSSGQVPARRIVLAGDSSGAALAISTACVMRDRRVDAVAGIVSLSGAFDATLSGESIDAGHDPQLARPVLEHWQRTVSPAVELHDPLMSPVFGSLHDLPPSLLLAGGDDIWLSDSIRLADELTNAGSSVLLRVAEGMWHVWPMYGEYPEAAAALTEIAKFVAIVTTDAPEPHHHERE